MLVHRRITVRSPSPAPRPPSRQPLDRARAAGVRRAAAGVQLARAPGEQRQPRRHRGAPDRRARGPDRQRHDRCARPLGHRAARRCRRRRRRRRVAPPRGPPRPPAGLSFRPRWGLPRRVLRRRRDGGPLRGAGRIGPRRCGRCRARRSGRALRRLMLVPEDEICFYFFTAGSRADVARVSEHAGLGHDRIVAAL